MADEPLVLAVTLVAPVLLGLALRWRGALLAALALAAYAVVRTTAGGVDAEEALGAAVLGAAGGLALGAAGALLRREHRRARARRRLAGPRRE